MNWDISVAWRYVQYTSWMNMGIYWFLPVYLDIHYIAYPLYSFCQNFVQLPQFSLACIPTQAAFSVVLFLWLNGWSCHMMTDVLSYLMILWIYTCRALVLIYLVPKGHCNVFYATIRQSELSTIPHVVTHFRRVSRCTLSCPAFGNQWMLFAECKTLLLFFFRKKCFVFCPALKLKNVGNYGQGYWDLTRFLRQSDLISQTNTHTHTQRYKTHSGASKLTHPKIYTYATFYELTAAIFITMNE